LEDRLTPVPQPLSTLSRIQSRGRIVGFLMAWSLAAFIAIVFVGVVFVGAELEESRHLACVAILRRLTQLPSEFIQLLLLLLCWYSTTTSKSMPRRVASAVARSRSSARENSGRRHARSTSYFFFTNDDCNTPSCVSRARANPQGGNSRLATWLYDVPGCQSFNVVKIGFIPNTFSTELEGAQRWIRTVKLWLFYSKESNLRNSRGGLNFNFQFFRFLWLPTTLASASQSEIQVINTPKGI